MGNLVPDKCCPTGCAISGTFCPVDFPTNSELCCEGDTARCESGDQVNCPNFDCVVAVPSG